MSTLSSLKRKQKRHKLANPLAGFKAKLIKDEDFKDRQIVFTHGEVKMSDVLSEFVAPYEDYARTYEEHQKLLNIAMRISS